MVLLASVSKPDKQEDFAPGRASEVPVIPYKVLHADLPFYSDPQAKNQVQDARILILEALDPQDKLMELDVVPTRLKFQPGQYLTWELNHKRLWEESWYKHPETGRIERAWNTHVEFIGRVISEEALIKERQRISDLERKVSERRAAAAREKSCSSN